MDINLVKEKIEEGFSNKEICKLLNYNYSPLIRFIKRNKLREFNEPLKKPRNTSAMIGLKYGMLTIIDFDHFGEPTISKKSKTGRKSFWKCKCNCGNEAIVGNSNLLHGGTTSCGCLHNERLQKLHKSNIKDKATFYAVLKDYKRGAEDRGFEWNISEQEFTELTSGNCYFCNEKPSKVKGSNGKVIYKGKHFVYNGLDRVDNSKGYNIDNCVTCCHTCNMIKGSFSVDVFIKKVIEIAKFQNDK